MKLEDYIINEAASKMMKEIDNGIIDTIMTQTLLDKGWTETGIKPAFSSLGMLDKSYDDWYSKTAEWCHLNATGDYKLIHGQWLFERDEDAVVFILRWA